MSKDLCTIVPAPSTPGSYTSTIGTKVLLPDGTQLRGVTGIKLIAHTNDVWRAEIECLAHVDAMPGMLVSFRRVGKKLALWQRALLWLAGVSAVSVDTLESDSEYQQWRSFQLRHARETQRS